MERGLEAALADRTSGRSPLRTVVENLIVQLSPHDDACLGTVAKRLGKSERTLARRLAAEGLHFGKVLDEVRRELAVRYLGDADLPIKEIAYRLGFNHPSAFSHACRRWLGRTPLDHRRFSSHPATSTKVELKIAAWNMLRPDTTFPARRMGLELGWIHTSSR